VGVVANGLSENSEFKHLINRVNITTLRENCEDISREIRIIKPRLIKNDGDGNKMSRGDNTNEINLPVRH
jgi:hypothetical protein